MPEPVYESVGTRQGISQRTSLALPLPAGIAAGKAIILYGFLDGNQGTVNPPAGYQHAPGSPVSIAAGGGAHQLVVVGKRADGTETGSPAITWNGTNRYCEGQSELNNTIVASGDIWDTPAVGDTNAATSILNSTTTPPVNITTAGADRLKKHAGTNWFGGAWTPGAGYTKRSTGSEDLYFGEAVQAAAGNTGNVTATCTGSNKSVALVFALVGTTGGGSTPAEGTVEIPLSLVVAPGGSTVNEGTVGIPVALTVSPSGSVDHGGTTTVPLGLVVSSGGSTDHAGSSPIGLALDLDPAGDAPPDGIASGTIEIPLVLSVSAEGAVSHSGVSPVSLTIGLAPVGQTSSEGTVTIDLALDLEPAGGAAAAGAVDIGLAALVGAFGIAREVLTPASRIYFVPAEIRLHLVSSDDRVYILKREVRG